MMTWSFPPALLCIVLLVNSMAMAIPMSAEPNGVPCSPYGCLSAPSPSEYEHSARHIINKRGLFDGAPSGQGPLPGSVSAPLPGADFLSNLANQANQMVATQQLLQSAQALIQNVRNPTTASQQAEGTVRQLADASQQTAARSLEGAQQTAQQTAQQSPSKIRAALTELQQGLQRITTTNPNLFPEVKQIYQRVTSTLSGQPMATPVQQPNNPYNIVPANSAEGLVDNLGKVVGIQPAQQPPSLYPNLLQSLQG